MDHSPAAMSPGTRVGLFVLSASIIAWGLFGLAFAFLRGTPLMVPLMGLLWEPFLGKSSPTPEYAALLDFVIGVLGAVMMSWALALLAVTWGALRHGQAWARWTVLGSALLWFAIDEFFSVRAGVVVNALGNLVLLAGLTLPLLVLGPPRPRTSHPSVPSAPPP